MRAINAKVELASGEYDRRCAANPAKKMPVFPVTMLFGIRPQALINYRANYISRNHAQRPGGMVGERKQAPLKRLKPHHEQH